MSFNAGADRLTNAFARLEVLRDLPDHRAFERLSALVLKHWLDEPAIHDVTLTGETGAPHQIDVVLGDDNQRALIECKFYKRRIDIPIVRNFFGQAEDVGCDLAAIVTTVGYSRNAEIYARGKNIDLLVLRETRDDDLEGLVQEVHLELTAVVVSCTGVTVEPTEIPTTTAQPMAINLSSPHVVLEFSDGTRRPLSDRWREIDGSFTVESPDGIYPIVDEFEGAPTLIVGDQRIDVRCIAWEVTVSRGTTVSVVKHEPFVTLVGAHGDVLRVSSENQLANVRLETWGT